MLRAAGIGVRSTPLGFKRYDFDRIPLPARDLIDMNAYYRLARRVNRIYEQSWPATNLITSRGCPGHCVFCSNSRLRGRKFIARSPELVADEMASLVDDYGARELVIFDDNWSADKRRTERMLSLMLERDLGITWYAQNTALWTMSDSILEKMAKTGCHRVKYSVESGSARVLKEIIEKPVNLDKVPAIVRKTMDLGMKVEINYVIGFPTETRAEIMDTFHYARDLGADSSIFNIAMPYNHTRLTQQAIDLGLLPRDFNFDALNASHAFWDGPDWAKEELEEWRHQFWLECNPQAQRAVAAG